MKDELLKIFSFYGFLGRPLTLIETWRALSKESQISFDDLIKELDELRNDGIIFADEGFFSLKKYALQSINRKKQDLLLDKKWQKLLRYVFWFDFVPFLDFVMASGSMALGNVHENSDFDVLVGVKSGRIFTARYALNFLFSILGLRRLDDEAQSSPDKLCFNHFVTESVFSKPPFNRYRRELYRNLTPLIGRPAAIKKFIKVNEWCGLSNLILADRRYQPLSKNIFRLLLEFLLGGRFGDWVENNLFAPIAKKRLNRYVLKRGVSGRVVVTKEELEFHFALDYEKNYNNH